jgi:hypothetical protein
MITISLQTETVDDMIFDLRELADKIDAGYTNGITNNGNCWSIDDDSEEE